MQWNELNLNRFGFKTDPDPVSSGSVEMSDSIGSSVSDSKSESGSQEVAGAKEIITGTVITSCILQSSGGPDRVEISKSLQDLETNITIPYDALGVYNNEELVVLIGKNGGFFVKLFGSDTLVNDIYVTNLLDIATSKRLSWINSSGTRQAYMYGDTSGNLEISSKTGAAKIQVFDAGYSEVKGHLYPDADVTYDLGDGVTPLRWRYIYGGFLDLSGGMMVGGTIYGADIDVTGTVYCAAVEPTNGIDAVIVGDGGADNFLFSKGILILQF